MRILELEIKNVRGIKEITLHPNGKNMVIWGPNGAGKSAVVDAVDFLLTGKISRLIGQGTAGISLKAHGPHIDHAPEDAVVSAKVRLRNLKDPILIQRSMSAPGRLVCDLPQVMEPILGLAALGQHVLSRREILKYVAAEAGKRAAEVQALLNLSEVEEIRKSFGRATNAARSELTAAEKSVRDAEAMVVGTLGLPLFDRNEVLRSINELRSVLGGDHLTDIRPETLREGIIGPAVRTDGPGVNPAQLLRVCTALRENRGHIGVAVVDPDKELRTRLQELRSNELALREISKLRLMELGVMQIPRDGSCPLCGAQWEPGHLREHLGSQILRAKAASATQSRIDEIATAMLARIAATKSQVMQLGHAANQLKMTHESSVLASWAVRISKFEDVLSDSVLKYSSPEPPNAIETLFAPDGVDFIIENLIAEVNRRTPQVSPAQSAWDTLTSLRENLRQLEAAQCQLNSATLFKARSEKLQECFEGARDFVLSNLYSSIESRFSQLYRLIHEGDEPEFDTTIRPSGAGLTFEVDFYGRGKFPPMALHSEGHQDTMGICLYLVLAERLTQKTIELTILDDVVMSVDAGHRRKICDLIASEFGDKQFLITTHDRTWARQLVTKTRRRAVL